MPLMNQSSERPGNCSFQASLAATSPASKVGSWLQPVAVGSSQSHQFIFFRGWRWAQKAPGGWRSPRRKRGPKTCRVPVGGVVQPKDARDLLSAGWLVNRFVLNDAAIWKSLNTHSRLTLIAGPCVIENEKLCFWVAA